MPLPKKPYKVVVQPVSLGTEPAQYSVLIKAGNHEPVARLAQWYNSRRSAHAALKHLGAVLAAGHFTVEDR